MKRSIVWLLLIQLPLLDFGSAQTLEEIIEKNIEARGGETHWQALRTLRIEGSYNSFSTDAPFTIMRKRPDLYRFEHTMIEKKITAVYSGTQAWWINPLYGKTEAVLIEGPDQNIVLRDKAFEPVFWNFDTKGHTVSLLGKEKVDGKDNFKIEVNLDSGSKETWYIDCQTFLETQMEGKTYDFGTEVPLTSYFSDYREVDGVVMPFRIEQEFGTRYRVFAISAITTGQELTDDLFAMPQSASAEGSDKQ